MHRDVILGAIIALVFLARPIWVYFFRGGSRLPTDAPRWERAATWISQISIYGSLAAVLASGFMIAYLAPRIAHFPRAPQDQDRQSPARRHDPLPRGHF